MINTFKQKTKRIWIVAAILAITVIALFSSRAFATILQPSSNFTIIQGKDILGVSLPLSVQGTATSTENTWGRLIRLSGANAPGKFFDIGIDDQGNFFINTPQDTKTSHSLVISPTGVVKTLMTPGGV
jgi:hypothetical protein